MVEDRPNLYECKSKQVHPDVERKAEIIFCMQALLLPKHKYKVYLCMSRVSLEYLVYSESIFGVINIHKYSYWPGLISASIYNSFANTSNLVIYTCFTFTFN